MVKTDSDLIDSLNRDGYAILNGVVSPRDCQRIAAEINQAVRARSGDAISAEKGRVVGGRNLLSQWSGWRELVEAPEVRSFAGRVLDESRDQSCGETYGVVRALYFDKPPGEGWSLALHKDRTIAVREHCDPLTPFAKPTRKAGVPHVEASEDLLRMMLTLRFHLDAMHDDNGPLIVVPGSHDASQAESETKTIYCDAGDVFVMRPLLSHGSRAASLNTQDHRRVLHLELAPSEELPGNYRWHQFEPVGRVFD